MARPRTDLPPASALRALVDGGARLAVQVTPGARTEGIKIIEGHVQVKVRARPEDGKATMAVIELVAKALSIPPSRITLLRGATSREKLFRILPEA